MIAFFPTRTIAVSLNGWTIHWYGLLYLLAFLLAWLLLPRLSKWRGLILSREDRLLILTASMAGVLIGGRLGYVLLYEPQYFWQHPSDILALWQGGMASHGGIIGVALALWLVTLISPPYEGGERGGTNKVLSPFQRGRTRGGGRFYLSLIDIITVPAAIGLALGRIGNIINQELFISVFSQWFAIGENLAVAGICYWYLRVGRRGAGSVTALFLLSYGTLRLVDELLRVQYYPSILGLTRGQWYTLPMIILGVWLWIKSSNLNWIKEPNKSTEKP